MSGLTGANERMPRLSNRLLAIFVAINWPGAHSAIMASDAKTPTELLAADAASYKGVPPAVLQLRRSACSICHLLPEPTAMPRESWEWVVTEMADYLQQQSIHLSDRQFAELQHFYQSFSPEELPRLPDDFLPPKLLFEKQSAGAPPLPGRPRIADVHITDLDQDGNADVIVCDDLQGTVSWIPYQKSLAGGVSQAGEIELAKVLAPVNSEIFDFDGDGDLDIAVASIGSIYPNDLLIGEAVLLINDGQQNFEKRVLVSGVPRLSDMQPGDIDGDGDMDFGLAMFGWLSTGAVGWLEQITPEKFELHTVQEINGAMHMELVDLDLDGRLDLVTLVSQQHEMILCFRNLGNGKFDPILLGEAQHPNFGSSSFQVVDLDQDGDLDILYSNGDVMDTSTSPKPYHGIQWLENTGNFNFVYHDITRFHSCYQAVAADMDGDGDLDVVGSNLYFDWLEHDMPSLIWLENDGKQHFTRRRIAYSPSNLATIDVGDLDGDKRPDIIAGGMHIPGPMGRSGRITVWLNKGLPK